MGGLRLGKKGGRRAPPNKFFLSWPTVSLEKEEREFYRNLFGNVFLFIQFPYIQSITKFFKHPNNWKIFTRTYGVVKKRFLSQNWPFPETVFIFAIQVFGPSEEASGEA